MIASIGIAVTAFLLTLQPALAFTPGGPHIFARQQLPAGLNFSSFNLSALSGCASACPSIAPLLENQTCYEDANCLCPAGNNIVACVNCAVSVQVIPQDSANALISLVNSSCGLNSSSASSTATTSATATASSKSGAIASVMSINTLGVMITVILGTVALL